MTKSTITREQLIKKAQEQIEFCRHTKITGEGRAHVNQCAALFEIALAAMDSEPVAYTDERNLGYIDRGRETAYLWGKQNSEAADVPLYRHAQPAPVVPDEMTIRDACKFVQNMRLFDDVSVIVMRTWNACRAAMLAAAPQSHGSEPATVPGKWIPVSERMPEKGQAVLVYRPKAHEGGDSDVRVAVYGRHNFEHGFGCYWEPTHWMPLPATPQEVKGE